MRLTKRQKQQRWRRKREILIFIYGLENYHTSLLKSFTGKKGRIIEQRFKKEYPYYDMGPIDLWAMRPRQMGYASLFMKDPTKVLKLIPCNRVNV
jgi:hypothetical protein